MYIDILKKSLDLKNKTISCITSENKILNEKMKVLKERKNFSNLEMNTNLKDFELLCDKQKKNRMRATLRVISNLSSYLTDAFDIKLIEMKYESSEKIVSYKVCEDKILEYDLEDNTNLNHFF